eukprot:13229078-Ditylum_brightwellii.AAC.1
MAREQNKGPRPYAVTSSMGKKRPSVTNVKFQGRNDDLKGFIFDTDPRNADRFPIVQEELARYVGANYKHGDLIAKAIRTLEAPAIDRPEDPGKNPDYYTKKLFKEAVKDYVRGSKILKQNIKKNYKLAWGQASKALQEKLCANPNFNNFNKERDVIMLLNAIKAAMYKYDYQKIKTQQCWKP